MKDISTSPQVQKQIEHLIQELLSLCIANNVPMIVSAVLKIENTGEGINISKAVASFFDTRTGAYDSTLAAASEIVRLDKVPDSAVYMLTKLRESTMRDTRHQTEKLH